MTQIGAILRDSALSLTILQNEPNFDLKRQTFSHLHSNTKNEPKTTQVSKITTRLS